MRDSGTKALVNTKGVTLILINEDSSKIHFSNGDWVYVKDTQQEFEAKIGRGQ
tara:strand:- start:1037 stop:1195 length:159 start_codon:yes stop_codon:yes gene_type:complete